MLGGLEWNDRVADAIELVRRVLLMGLQKTVVGESFESSMAQ
jgi:hypothetical protein